MKVCCFLGFCFFLGNNVWGCGLFRLKCEGLKFVNCFVGKNEIEGENFVFIKKYIK